MRSCQEKTVGDPRKLMPDLVSWLKKTYQWAAFLKSFLWVYDILNELTFMLDSAFSVMYNFSLRWLVNELRSQIFCLSRLFVTLNFFISWFWCQFFFFRYFKYFSTNFLTIHISCWYISQISWIGSKPKITQIFIVIKKKF